MESDSPTKRHSHRFSSSRSRSLPSEYDYSPFSKMEFDSNNIAEENNNHRWQKVIYAKKKRNNRAKQQVPSKSISNGSVAAGNGNVFNDIEKKSEQRRKVIEAQRLTIHDPDPPVRSSRKKNYSDYEDSDEEVVENSVAIDADELASFLLDVTTSFEAQQDIQLMKFADYFGRAFASVTASQFPWVKLFRESPVGNVADNPVSHIPEVVYKTSVDWINKRSMEALGSFCLWSLDNILADLASQLGGKGSKKGAQKTSPKSQAGLFVVLAMVLRRKPDVLITVLPTLNETLKHQRTRQASSDFVDGNTSITRGPCLERILSAPKAETILVNGAVRKGERLLPPSALDLLLRATFPSSSARVKATERFEAVYPTLKKVALAGSPGSKAMKQVSQQILTISLKACGEGIPELSHEASSIFVWCLTQNPDCCKQWDKSYSDNLEASIIILRRLNEQWKDLSQNPPSLEALTETLKSLKRKNEKEMTEGDKSGDQALYNEADKQCKVLLRRSSGGRGCLKATVFLVITLGVGATFLPLTILESLDWIKLSEILNTK
ncbi:hypothetical protein L1987_62751 [Smallanthus sonchifolius]|uniref:Uncharacterized protein n=1 Tax=Smallanthus sonchifolius TaxID=185202 RepID=A0ACB9CBM6_9ASTR|nr:hypothetical protein L1987_62751 [Smallanthus sonchifolius]